MAPQQDNEAERLRKLAESLDCITEEDFRLLADITPGTCEAWRKRGQGPAYIRCGTRYYYPKKSTAEWMQTLVRERRHAPAAGVL